MEYPPAKLCLVNLYYRSFPANIRIVFVYLDKKNVFIEMRVFCASVFAVVNDLHN